ncbi:MAG: diaminopimelate decarboxylase [Thermoleophilia bacterium]
MSIIIPPLPRSTRVNAGGHLEVGGCDVAGLAGEFGTPLFIYDEQEIRSRCREYRRAFESRAEDARIIYASKAFACLALFQLMAEEGLSLDVASGGELFTALSAWFPPEDIFLHGNANTRDELHQAVRNEVGHVVLDSLDELGVLDEVAAQAGRIQPVLLRVTPGIEAHTHDYIQTGKQDSKFGFTLGEGAALAAVKAVMAAAHLKLVGLHCHIGSQIFSMEPYRKTAAVIADFMAQCREQLGFECRLLDMGGGLGIAYTADDQPPSVADYAEAVTSAVAAETRRAGLELPRIAVEPGRSIVANAGLTAYEIETIKSIPGVRKYAAVNGGMSDNLRPALYGAAYTALIASRPEAAPTETVTIAGKHCESGDILVKDAPLPDPVPGDILVTPATGAYGYSMASNYNGQPRPAVVFVRDGNARVVIRRETYEDLIRLNERSQ